MWIRLAGDCAFDYVPDALVKRFVHEGQITADLAKKIAGREQILHKYSDLLSQKPETLAKHLWRLGVLYCTDEQFWKGRRCFIEAIRQQPRRKGTYKHLLLAALAPGWHRRYLLRRYMGSADGVRIYY
jgi:hypothetical protein